MKLFIYHKNVLDLFLGIELSALTGHWVKTATGAGFTEAQTGMTHKKRVNFLKIGVDSLFKVTFFGYLLIIAFATLLFIVWTDDAQESLYHKL